MKKLLIVLLFLSLLATTAYAQSGKGTVAPFSSLQNITQPQYIDTSGADKKVSFWDVPLWIKIACIIQGILALLIMIKVIPIIIGKIIKRHKSTSSIAIKRYVINNPGSTISQVSKDTAINRNTVKYYILNFVSSGKIILEHMGKFSRIFYKDARYDEKEKTVMIHLRNRKVRQILLAIINDPGMTGAELANKFHIKRSSMHWHIKRLLKDEIVTFRQEGMYKKYYVNPEAEKIINKYKELYIN